MTTENLLRAMRAVFELDVQKAPKQHRLRTPQCPLLGRIVEALEKGWKPEEQEHVAGCAYCQMIVRMNEEEERLEAAGVNGTQEQEAAPLVMKPTVEDQPARKPVADGQALKASVFPIPLRAPFAAAAETGEPIDVRGPAADLDLEWWIREKGDQIVFHVCTKDLALAQKLLRYELHGPEGCEPVTGCLALEPDDDGWFAAKAVLSAVELLAQLQGECHHIVVTAVNADRLTTTEREDLLASLSRSGDTERRQMIQQLLEQTDR